MASVVVSCAVDCCVVLCCVLIGVLFFFSSRRRHTRSKRDWSSDVCSSDLMLVPAPWRKAFGQAKPYKVGIMQPLTGVAAAGGKTALVGSMMAIDRVNKTGGVNGRPLEAIVADYESKPDVGRRKVEKLLVEDQVDVAEGGYLSNVCVACMPVFDEHRTVFMVGVCLD